MKDALRWKPLRNSRASNGPRRIRGNVARAPRFISYWTLIEIGTECVVVPIVNETVPLGNNPTGVPGS